MCFRKRHKTENLVVISIFKYEGKSKERSTYKYTLHEFKIATKSALKDVQFDHWGHITTMDGSTYSTEASGSAFAALSSKPLIEAVDLSKKRKKAGFTTLEALELQKAINREFQKDNDGDNPDSVKNLLDAKDLF